MQKNLPVLILLIGIFSFLPLSAGEVRQLSWRDLIPASSAADDPLARLTQKQKDLAYWVINMLEALPPRSMETEEFYQEVDKAMPELKKAGIDIVAIMAKRKKNRTAVVGALNGQQVSIPGYLLPLEASGGKVTEFLLVPYIGACIHVPPPPPNQIVHVNVIQKGGYKNSRLYEPVQVTGKIDVKSMVKDLFLADGSAGIDIGYAMQANLVEPYRK